MEHGTKPGGVRCKLNLCVGSLVTEAYRKSDDVSELSRSYIRDRQRLCVKHREFFQNDNRKKGQKLISWLISRLELLPSAGQMYIYKLGTECDGAQMRVSDVYIPTLVALLGLCFDSSECFRDLHVWSRVMGNKSGKLRYMSRIVTVSGANDSEEWDRALIVFVMGVSGTNDSEEVSDFSRIEPCT